ncbi:MAG: hypothetical protein AMXMBFR47_17810 [Planctomycetota bacterium]
MTRLGWPAPCENGVLGDNVPTPASPSARFAATPVPRAYAAIRRPIEPATRRPRPPTPPFGKTRTVRAIPRRAAVRPVPRRPREGCPARPESVRSRPAPGGYNPRMVSMFTNPAAPIAYTPA